MSPKIMVVDDAMFMRNKIKKILTGGGFDDIIESSNGREAVETYKEHRPDLVTMDIVMPDMDGIAALGQIIAFDPEAKVVMITAMGQQRMVVDAIKRGAMDFITKPFKEDRVMEIVRQVLSGDKKGEAAGGGDTGTP